MPHHPQNKEFLPNTESNPALWQREVVPSCPKPLSSSLEAPLVMGRISKVSLEPSPGWSTPILWPFLMAHVLQTLDHFMESSSSWTWSPVAKYVSYKAWNCSQDSLYSTQYLLISFNPRQIQKQFAVLKQMFLTIKTAQIACWCSNAVVTAE